MCLLLHNLWWCLKVPTTRNHHGYVKFVKREGRKHDIRSQSKTKTKNLIDLNDGIFCTICLKSCFPNLIFNFLNSYTALYYNVNVYIFFPTKMSFLNYFTFLFFFCRKKHWLHYFKTFLSIPHSSYSFQNLPDVLTIHQKYFHINLSQIFNINLDVIVFTKWKANSWDLLRS